MASFLITGGTGLIGTALKDHLVATGHDVIILSRQERSSDQARVSYAKWDIENQTIEQRAIAAADYIIHLAGANVADKRWTDTRKDEILKSRTKTSELLIKGLREIPNKVKAVISASAIGWYGDDNIRSKRKKSFTEDMPADETFLGETCKKWEESIKPVETELGKRLVIYRIGIVLSNAGGALPEIAKPIKLGIAGLLGGGKQVYSWIHISDICRAVTYAAENEEISGVYNAVAPTPVTNKELTLELANRIRPKFFVPMHVPSFLLKMILGQMSVEVLKSATVSGEKLRLTGFQFQFPSIEPALDHLAKQLK